MRFFIFLFFFFAAFIQIPAAIAAESIWDYRSRIEVLSDGDLKVTESIEVMAEGTEIRHGIYRALPRRYYVSMGGFLPMSYDILSVKRDGQEEPYRLEKSGDYLRIYIGDQGKLLPAGKYLYELTYTARDQVSFFKDSDELIWNVVGTEWIFSINKASATVILPGAAPILSYAVYTGEEFSTEGDYEAEQREGELSVRTSHALLPGQGMTVSLSWPKEYVQPGDGMTGLAFFLRQHPGLILMTLAFGATAIFYSWAWWHFGRDPRRRRLAPFYVPPKGISPAMAAYIQNMGETDAEQCLTAAIVSLAVKGYLTIEETKRGQYRVVPTGLPEEAGKEILKDEKILHKKIDKPMPLHGAGDFWENLCGAHGDILEKLCVNQYFIANTERWMLGMIPAFLALCLFWLLGYVSHYYLIIAAGILFFGDVARQVLLDNRRKSKSKILFSMIAMVAMIVIGAIILIGVEDAVSWLTALATAVTLTLIIFIRIGMRALTPEGTDIAEQVDGLKYYMEAVEEKILKTFDPPQMSRQLYEDYLPYAIALNVESKWGDKFAATMDEATLQNSSPPSWYKNEVKEQKPSPVFSASAMSNDFKHALGVAMAEVSSGGGRSSRGGGWVGKGGGGGGGGGW